MMCQRAPGSFLLGQSNLKPKVQTVLSLTSKQMLNIRSFSLQFPRMFTFIFSVDMRFIVVGCVRHKSIAFFFPSFFWLSSVACRILVPQTGMGTVPSAVEPPSLSHWTAREVSGRLNSKWIVLYGHCSMLGYTLYIHSVIVTSSKYTVKGQRR